MSLIIPEHYDPVLSIRETEEAIKFIRDLFQEEFAKQMNLERVSAPLFVYKDSGLNDNLNGVERPVSFDMRVMPQLDVEIVQSLAKWKRYALKKYGYRPGEGIYTNMNAIRRDENPDNLHSFYVDQWDWERVIRKEDRTIETLEDTVRRIYTVIKHMEHEVWYRYPKASYHIADEITFINSQDLLDQYPDMTARERENAAAKKYGAVFIEQIGGALSDGKPHDRRAPDYDDWKLNGDILVWYEPLKCSFELSSMGIRVSEESLAEQLREAGCEERRKLPFHRMLLSGELPYTIGGGIGQSRLCMMLLRKAHIGEVQAGIWPNNMRKQCEEAGILLL